MLSCLDNIIGMTRTPCECLKPDLPEDYMISKSGLYLDELPECPINLKASKSIQDCGKNMAFMLTQAISQATAEVKRELYKDLLVRYSVKNKPYVGEIGSFSYTRTLTDNSQYMGMILQSTGLNGATVTID